MEKLQLPSVTLFCADCVDVDRAIAIVEYCKTLADFGDVKVLSNQERNNYPIVKISNLYTLEMYSTWMLTECHKYFDTDHVLVVQRDGWILNPEQWNNDWLQYDYVAPLFNQYDYVGCGGFSLRSKKVMEATSRKFENWDGTEETANRIQAKAGLYEDGVIGFNFQDEYKICPIDVANKFAQGGNLNISNHYPKPFGFHGGFRIIDFSNGTVEPPKEDDSKIGQVLITEELTKKIKIYATNLH